MILADHIILSLSDKHGKCNKVVPEKEKIECLNVLGHKFDFDRVKLWIYSKGTQCVQIKPVGLPFTGQPIGSIKENLR